MMEKKRERGRERNPSERSTVIERERDEERDRKG